VLDLCENLTQAAIALRTNLHHLSSKGLALLELLSDIIPISFNKEPNVAVIAVKIGNKH
jgi:hypothetical protein